MAIKSLLGDVVPQAIGAGLGSAKQKITEGTDRLLSSTGGWGDFKKVVSNGVDKVKGAANFTTTKKKLEAQGVAPTDVDELIRQMSPPAEGTALDSNQANLDLLAAVDADVTAQQLKAALNVEGSQLQEHKVRLVEKKGNGDYDTFVVFDIMPEVVESRTVEYEAIAPPQHPTAFQKYKGTSSTQWTINATLVCRNIDEATENLRILNVLRGWTMPFFGENTRVNYPTKLGAPPPVLEFSGWKDQMVGPVQVVLTSLNWNFPQDVDYISARSFVPAPGTPGGFTTTDELIPFPTVIKIAIQLVESFSTDQVNSFDLSSFRAGRVDVAFKQSRTLIDQNGLTTGAAVPDEEAQRLAASADVNGLDLPLRPEDMVASDDGSTESVISSIQTVADDGSTGAIQNELQALQDEAAAPPVVRQRKQLVTLISREDAKLNAYERELDIAGRDYFTAQLDENADALPRLQARLAAATARAQEQAAYVRSLGLQYEALSDTGGGS